MAATLALFAAFLFALAAALQQKGALNLPTISLADPMLVRPVREKAWLIGTLALFTGYLFQAGALDRGRFSVIQPLLVTTVVFALPLGYVLTRQHVGRREVVGATVILVGLGLFVYFGDPAGGTRTPSTPSGQLRSRCSQRFPSCCSFSERRPLDEGGGVRNGGGDHVRALVCADEADARLPPREREHDAVPLGVRRPRSRRRRRVRPAAGVARNGPAGAVRCHGVGRGPIVGILIGILFLDERLSRRAWHILVAVVGLGLALVGAVVISLAREATKQAEPAAAAPDESVAKA